MYTMHSVPVSARMVPYGVLAGMAAGGTLIMSAIPAASLVYILTIIIPMIVASVIYSADGEWLFGSCLVIYVGIMLHFALQHSRRLWHGELSVRMLQARMDDLTQAHDEIEKLARTDIVTGLPNRRAFNSCLQSFLDDLPSDTAGKVLPVYLVDLDHFKAVNDAYGHEIGDAYLCQIADRLRENTPFGWKVARLGGDEFAIAARDLIAMDEAIQLGQRMIDRIGDPIEIEPHSFQPRCSVGLVFAPHHAVALSELLAFADYALMTAKNRARGQLVMFDIADKNILAEDREEGRRLFESLADDAIEMVYQPQYCLETHRFTSMESLVRWRHPDGHFIGPARLFHIAEVNGMLPELCKRIIDLVAADIGRWRRSVPNLPRVAVNLHPIQLKNSIALLEQVDALAEAAGGADRVVLEITENCIVGRGTEGIPACLGQLAERGFILSLDDFGTGFASLSHLSELPIGEIKIDKRFVAHAHDQEQAHAIIVGVYGIAKKMNLAVIAEGIETAEQEAALRDIGPMIGQGYLYSKPLQEHEVGPFIAENVVQQLKLNSLPQSPRQSHVA